MSETRLAELRRNSRFRFTVTVYVVPGYGVCPTLHALSWRHAQRRARRVVRRVRRREELTRGGFYLARRGPDVSKGWLGL